MTQARKPKPTERQRLVDIRHAKRRITTSDAASVADRTAREQVLAAIDERIEALYGEGRVVAAEAVTGYRRDLATMWNLKTARAVPRLHCHCHDDEEEDF